MSEKIHLQVSGSTFEHRLNWNESEYGVPMTCTITQLRPGSVALSIEHPFGSEGYTRNIVIPVGPQLVEALTDAYYESLDQLIWPDGEKTQKSVYQLIWPEEDDNGKER